MIRSQELFDKFAFINISLNTDHNITYRKDIINKPLLIAFSVLLANRVLDDIKFNKYNEQALTVLATHLKENSYQNSISKATGDERNIKTCLEHSLEVLKECGIISQ